MEENKIHRYLNNLMTDAERADFEAALKASPELAEEVQFARNLNLVTKHKATFQTKALISELMAEINPQPDFGKYADLMRDNDTPVPKSRQSWILRGAVVGAVAVAALGYYFYGKAKNENAKELTNKYLKTTPMENIMHFDSTDTRPLAQIMAFYDRGQSDSALFYFKEFGALPEIKNDSTAQLYQAICLLNVQKTPEATHILRGLTTSTDKPLRQVAIRYLAFARLADGQIAEARKLFESLTTDPVFGDKARQILMEL